MPENSVYLRDLPYEFLKKQSISSLSSIKMADHEKLFKSLKTNSLLKTTPNAESDELPLSVMEGLRDLIQKKYNGSLVIPFDDNRLMIIYYYIQAKVVLEKKSEKLKKRIYTINNSVANLSDSNLPTVLKRVIENPFIKKLRSVDKATVDKANLNGLRPPRSDIATPKPLLDIIKSSKFYQSSSNALIHDDLLYSTYIMNKTIQESNIHNDKPSWKYKNTLNYLNVNDYEYKYQDIGNLVELVKKLINDKYLAKHSAQVSKNTINITQDMLRDAIIAKFKEPKSEPRFVLVKLESVNSNFINGVINFHIDDFNIPKFFIYSVLRHQTKTINKNVVVTQSTGTSSLLVDSQSSDCSITLLVHKNNEPFKLSEVDTRLFAIDEFEIDYVSNTWVLDYDGADDNFVFQVESNDQVIIPTSIKLLSDTRIEFIFSTPISGKLYILSCIKNWSIDFSITVTNDNIDRVLSNVNFFKKDYRKWIQ
jgi:hypothetical protein